MTDLPAGGNVVDGKVLNVVVIGGTTHIYQHDTTRYHVTKAVRCMTLRYKLAFRRHHSTETAMLRVVPAALLAADGRHVTLRGLLDRSAAFDCVYHDLLPRRLHNTVV